MSFPSQATDQTKLGMGYIRVRINSNSSNPAPTVLGKVSAVGDIDMKDGLYEHEAYNSTGAKQIVAIIKTMLASGKVTLTLDEIRDVDDTSIHYSGEQVNVDLTQIFPNSANSATAWRFLAGAAYLNWQKLAPGTDKPTTLQLEIIPHAAAGTAPWTFDPAYTP